MPGPSPRRLGAPARVALRFRGGGRIGRELLFQGSSNRLGYVVLLGLVVVLPILAVIATQTVVPVVVYTLV